MTDHRTDAPLPGTEWAWLERPGNGGSTEHRVDVPGRRGRPVRCTVLVASVLTAGVLGGALALIPATQLTSVPVAVGPVVPAQVIVNSTENAGAVTAAAQKAAAGVVTISASTATAAGTGSGIILDSQGHILTNTHVVTMDGQAATATLAVRTDDGNVYPATVVGTDPLSDLSVVKIDAANLVPAVLGDSAKVNVGDTAIAIGAPLGLHDTVTNGIVSAVNRTISIASSAPQSSGSSAGGNGRRYRFAPPNGSQSDSSTAQDISIDVLQTDAAVNPGNSGGPLLNAAGQVIGVNVAIASAGATTTGTQSGNIGVGFAIEINNARRIMGEIIANGSATHGQLGATLASRPASAGSQFTVGAEVTSVAAGGAADKAGIQKGDIITEIGARCVQDAEGLTAAVRDEAGGATVKITLLRGGKELQLNLNLGTAPTS